MKLQKLDPAIGGANEQGAQEILASRLHDQFPVDVMQGGAGTSTNMNFNEVLANRALELSGHKIGEFQYIHPNDHVNLSQSTNDTYPTAVRIAVILAQRSLSEALNGLASAFEAKAGEFYIALQCAPNPVGKSSAGKLGYGRLRDVLRGAETHRDETFQNRQ